MLRGTTLIHLSLTAQALTSAGCVHQKHPILRRGDGRSRRSLMANRHSVRDSETIFPIGQRVPFQQPGLSEANRRGYSSLHCLCGIPL